MYVVDVRSNVARINANVRMTELNPVFDFRLSMFRWFTSEDLTHTMNFMYDATKQAVIFNGNTAFRSIIV